MPLTFTITEGVLPKGEEKVAFARLSEAMLKWHGLKGNRKMTANLVGSIHLVPEGSTYIGMETTPVAFVEWKVPSFAFADRAVQRGYFAEATDIIHELSGGKHPRNKVFINVVHAVDGAWNLDGVAMTNAEISEAVAKGA
jgi:hypothetical protein